MSWQEVYDVAIQVWLRTTNKAVKNVMKGVIVFLLKNKPA
jgi:hypothetical protein